MKSFAAVNPIFPVPITPTVRFLISGLNIYSSTIKFLFLLLSTIYAPFLTRFIAKVIANSAIALGEYLGTLAILNPISYAASKSI